MKNLLKNLTTNRYVLLVWIAVKLVLVIQFARDTVGVIYQGF